MPKTKPFTKTTQEELADAATYAQQLRDATADELVDDELATPGEELLAVGRALIFALQEIAARLELLELRAVDNAATLEETIRRAGAGT